MIKIFKKHWEVISYLIFGVLTTLLNIVLYALFNRLFGYTAANSWGNVLDNILCILFAYATNRAFVFNSRTKGRAMAKEFGAFVTCRLGTMVLDAAIMMIGGNLMAAQGAAWMEGLLTGVFTHLNPETLVGITSTTVHTTDSSAAIAVIGGGRWPHGRVRGGRGGPVPLGAVRQGVLECDRCGAELCVQQADHL